MGRGTLASDSIWGMTAGLVGTAVMDVVIVGFFAATGTPLGLIYSFIGDVVQQCLLRIGVAVAGGVPSGLLVHFFLGLFLGAVFGAVVFRVSCLRPDSLVKGALLGVLYIEIVSQPILVLAPLTVPMSTSEVLQWYVLSASMHVIYGVVLGVGAGLRRRRSARSRIAAEGAAPTRTPRV